MQHKHQLAYFTSNASMWANFQPSTQIFSRCFQSTPCVVRSRRSWKKDETSRELDKTTTLFITKRLPSRTSSNKAWQLPAAVENLSFGERHELALTHAAAHSKVAIARLATTNHRRSYRLNSTFFDESRVDGKAHLRLRNLTCASY